VFGYVTATIATFLIGPRSADLEPDLAGDISALRREVRELRDAVERQQR
jgi:hypothetical protein